MDPISYSLAAKQGIRIEKFIKNPDSTSGVLTQPSVIATGETITIPAGRTAIMANTQIDGTLVIDGDVFIPSGATFGGLVEKVASTDNAIVRFNGTTGEVQDSSIIVNDSGNITVGITPVVWRADRTSMDLRNASFFGYSTGANIMANGYVNSAGSYIYKASDLASWYSQSSGAHNWFTATSGVAGNVISWTNAMTLDSSGNLLLTSGTGALGYGTGAGGVVAQLTSKSTAVTLNKPTGQITMNNAALAAGANVLFAVNNSLVSNIDSVFVTGIYDSSNPTIDPDNYRIETSSVQNGAFYIRITNITAVTLSNALAIKFNIIKGATA